MSGILLRMKSKYTSAKFDVTGAEYSRIKTIDGTVIKKEKGKLNISVDIQGKCIVTIDVFVLQNSPYDLVLGQNYIG